MIKIIFEAHGTTFDNENHKASGLNDVNLSSLGKKQASNLGKRYKYKKLDAVFCSKLRRSFLTAKIAFSKRKIRVIRDERLNEIDYGRYNGYPDHKIKKLKIKYIAKSFPGGQSYTRTTSRVKSFLKDLRKNYSGKTVIIIGHRATQYALEFLINKKPLNKVISADWHWQSGWKYILK